MVKWSLIFCSNKPVDPIENIDEAVFGNVDVDGDDDEADDLRPVEGHANAKRLRRKNENVFDEKLLNRLRKWDPGNHHCFYLYHPTERKWG